MKSELRSFFLKKRREVFDLGKSIQIADKLRLLDEYRSAEGVMSYASYNCEVATDYLNEKILADGKRLFLPRCDVEGKKLIICEVRDLSELSDGAYGIKEPKTKGISPENVDLVIVPMVAFDRFGTRLGYGGGYYDRFLPTVSATRCAIAFSAQEAEGLPAEANDARMDMIVTEKEVIFG